MNKRLTIIAYLMVLALWVTACGSYETGQDTNPASDNSFEERDDPGTDEGSASEETSGLRTNNDEVLLEEGERIPVKSLGNASYKLSDIRVSEKYKPGRTMVMNLTDPKGNEWTLIISKGALLSSQTITMRYIEEIDQDLLSGDNICGVVLEPEGLYFIVPPFLKVSGPSVSDKSCALTATSEGDGLNFARSFFVEEDNALTATIDHFSSGLLYTPSSQLEIEDLQEMATEAYNEAVDEIKKFLKTPISVPPIPPDIEISCKENDNRAISMYMERVMQPEVELIRKILEASRNAALVGNEEEGLYYAQKIVPRLIKKADKLIETYQNDNNKLIPVMHVTFRILKDAALIGYETDEDYYFNVFCKWSERVAEELINEIRNEHMYTNICKVLHVMRGMELLGHDSNTLYEYRPKLADALKFELVFEGEITDVDSEGGFSVWKTYGKAYLHYDIIEHISHEVFLSGIGECKYTDYTHNGQRDTKLAESTEYTEVRVPYKGATDNSYQIEIKINNINPNSLVYTKPDAPQVTIPFMNAISAGIFSDYYDGYNYVLPIELQNGKAEITQDMTGQLENAEGTYVFTLQHTPK